MDTSLQQRIQSADLTRTEKRIADYFLDHSESLYFMTARDIAQELGVSDTSIIRLCRALGYRGFRELQESQRAELAQVMESGRYVIPRQQVEGKLEQYQNCSPFQCLQLAMETLQETYRKNRPEKFERAAQLLLQSEHIFISGFRGFSGSARYMGVLLSQYINRVTYYCDADTRCVEGLIDYGSQDCVVVFGAERYSRMSCVLAQIARDAHCRLIVITDKLTAPLAVGADIVLLADFTSPTAVNSYLGVNFLVEAIAFEVSRQLGVFPSSGCPAWTTTCRSCVCIDACPKMNSTPFVRQAW